MQLPRTLIITSCTAEKRFKPKNALVLEDFKDPERLRRRDEELSSYRCTAGELYTGRQHLLLMQGVAAMRSALGAEAVDVAVVSAGYGLVNEGQTIVPYELTFNTMSLPEVHAWGQRLGIREAVEALIKQYDLVFFLLGENYLRAVRLPVASHPNQTLVFLASQGGRRHIGEMQAQTHVTQLSNAEAKKYSYGIIALKGYLMKRFLELVARDAALLERTWRRPFTFEKALDDTLVTRQPLFPDFNPKEPRATKMVPKEHIEAPSTDKLDVSFGPSAPNVELGMQYFIPDTDDRVDAGFDFITDSYRDEQRDPFEDAYAHEFFARPNYDGILVSKVVIESSKHKAARVESDGGIHRHLRYQGPVMGDCGAFGYISQESPPFHTEEIIDYYHRYGFDFGVSIDHLIVGPFARPGVREKRYDTTLRNAEEFLKTFQSRSHFAKLSFSPIAAIQGWDPDTYAAMAEAVIAMGYDYIALGGLARARTTEIIEIMLAVRDKLHPSTRVHLFGVGRIDAIPALRHLGVTSFDSAGPLRQAWLASTANYHTLEGRKYPAIRVREAKRFFKSVDQRVDALTKKRVQRTDVAKKSSLDDPLSEVIQKVRTDVLHEYPYYRLTESVRSEIAQLEQQVLTLLREFHKGGGDLELTLATALAYEEVVYQPSVKHEPPTYEDFLNARAEQRVRHERLYRQLLADRPWQQCTCSVCTAAQVGVEVVIFRGNNRNRRRGFHNTFVFYRRFRDLLAELRNEDSRSRVQPSSILDPA